MAGRQDIPSNNDFMVSGKYFERMQQNFIIFARSNGIARIESEREFECRHSAEG